MSNSKFELKAAKLAKHIKYMKPANRGYSDYDYEAIDHAIGEGVVITNAGTTLVWQNETVFQILFSAELERVRFMIDNEFPQSSKVEMGGQTFVKSSEVLGKLYAFAEESPSAAQRDFCRYARDSLMFLGFSPEISEIRDAFHDSLERVYEIDEQEFIRRQNLIYPKSNTCASGDFDEYFLSKQHKFIYALLELDIEKQRELLDITDELHFDELVYNGEASAQKAKKAWYERLSGQLENSSIEGADDAKKRLEELYNDMSIDYWWWWEMHVTFENREDGTGLYYPSGRKDPSEEYVYPSEVEKERLDD